MSLGVKSSFAMVTVVVAAQASDAESSVTAARSTGKPRIRDYVLLQIGRDVLGMLLMALEQLQTGLQQALQFAVLRRRNQKRLQRAVDLLVIGNLVAHVFLVEGRTAELGELGAFVGRCLGQRLRRV